MYHEYKKDIFWSFRINSKNNKSALIPPKCILLGLEKTVKQIKAKLARLKDAYKQAKDNNSKSGASPQYCQYYNDFDEVLGERDTISFKNVKEVGCTDRIELHTPIEGKKNML